jgi:predicted kinase
MSPLVVVTGVPGAGKTGLATALAHRLGSALVSLDEIKEELAADAADTPREWLRLDAEAELVRRLEAFEGDAVVDIWVAPRRDTERLRGLLDPWWADVVEVRCEVPAELAVARYVARGRTTPPHLPPDADTLDRIREAAEHPESLGAPRTVVVDTSGLVDVGDVVTAVRDETGRWASARPGPRDVAGPR